MPARRKAQPLIKFLRDLCRGFQNQCSGWCCIQRLSPQRLPGAAKYFGYSITSNSVCLNRMPRQKTLAAVCAAAIAFISFVATRRFCLLDRAKDLIADVQSLDKGPDPTVAAVSFTKKYQRYLVEKSCDRDLCQFRFVLDNRALSIPRLAKRADIAVTVSLFHQQLDEVMVDLTSNVFKEYSPTAHVAEAFCKDRTDIPCTDFAINPHGHDAQPTWNGHILMSQLASEDQKRAAWDFNFKRLVAYYGCRDIGELNPLIWKRTRPNKVSSRLRSTADSIAEAARPLPG
jgi:hypothetical protein